MSANVSRRREALGQRRRGTRMSTTVSCRIAWPEEYPGQARRVVRNTPFDATLGWPEWRCLIGEAESAARVVGVGYRNVGVYRGVAFRRGILLGAAFQTRGIREAEGLRAVPYRGFVRRPLARAVAWRRGWEG